MFNFKLLFNYFFSNYFFFKRGATFSFYLLSFIILVSTIIVFFLLAVLIFILYVFFFKVLVFYIGHIKEILEVFAFFFSTFALILIAIPSMMLLYIYSSQNNVDLIVKIVGSQWYWNFDIRNLMEDSTTIYILSIDDISVGNSNFLEVDNVLNLPVNICVIFNVTRSDVIHAFSLPRLGLKVDATPGLLCVVPLKTLKIGTHVGQCSEICGINHSFIPFFLEIGSICNFMYYYLF